MGVIIIEKETISCGNYDRMFIGRTMFLACVSSMLLCLTALSAQAQQQFETDVVPTSAGDITITFIGHASLKFTFGGKNIYIDPNSKLADYAQLPKADLVVITHEHPDHLDPVALKRVQAPKTNYILSEGASRLAEGGMVMQNGDVLSLDGLQIEAVPAYNIKNKRENGEPFHPKGGGNGYIFTFGDKRVYVAGDTENIPEMKQFGVVDIAFLPMNLPYTMTPEMTADAAKMIQPTILYPYHYGETDPRKLIKLLKDEKGIEVRIRKMK